MTRPTQDLDMARAFLNKLDPDGVFTFQTFDDNAERKSPALARVYHGDFDQFVQALIASNNDGAGTFVMVNKGDGKVPEGKKTCRNNVNVRQIRALFVDLDGAPFPPDLSALPPPHIVVESSPDKWHIYWRTSDCRLDDFRAFQMALAARFQGDPSVHDLARVMRLPGFLHNKTRTPFLTRLVEVTK